MDTNGLNKTKNLKLLSDNLVVSKSARILFLL